jgi:hypothetical protein
MFIEAAPFVAEALLVTAGVPLVSRVVPPPHGRDATEPVRGFAPDVIEGLHWTVPRPRYAYCSDHPHRQRHVRRRQVGSRGRTRTAG